ncbi:hypothetical protein LNQ03_08285 [Klebsiella pneumoniae subsp. pneumoniae]|nr:hypothetical protein [Klebsiella pneumoniae subsp. pneumoniae]
MAAGRPARQAGVFFHHAQGGQGNRPEALSGQADIDGLLLPAAQPPVFACCSPAGGQLPADLALRRWAASPLIVDDPRDVDSAVHV